MKITVSMRFPPGEQRKRKTTTIGTFALRAARLFAELPLAVIANIRRDDVTDVPFSSYDQHSIPSGLDDRLNKGAITQHASRLTFQQHAKTELRPSHTSRQTTI